MKPKAVNWELAEEPEIYRLVAGLVKQYHGGKNSIDNVNYIVMWRHNVKQDQDGFIPLADITKSNDKVRELRPHDVIIGINKDAWSIMDDNQQQVVIDCQLERIAICLDKENNPKEDDRSRDIYRLRRLEVLDDHTMTRRHGITIHDVQEFVYSKFNEGDAEKGSYVADQLEKSESDLDEGHNTLDEEDEDDGFDTEGDNSGVGVLE